MKVHPTSRQAPRLATVLLAIAAALAHVSSAKLPHFVIVHADDLGQGDLSGYNPKAGYQAPRIDRLAAEGIRFTGVGQGNWKYLDHKGLGGNKYEGDLAPYALPEQERD